MLELTIHTATDVQFQLTRNLLDSKNLFREQLTIGWTIVINSQSN